MTQFHKHHIIPKYKGGTDAPENLIDVTIEEHADLHLKLWEECGDYRDLLACHGLLGLVGKDDIMKKIFHENGKKVGALSKGKVPWNKGKTNIYSLETLNKIRNSKIGTKRSIASRMKQSMTAKGKPGKPKTEEHKKNLSAANKGKRWYFNEILGVSKQMHSCDVPDQTWKLGMRR